MPTEFAPTNAADIVWNQPPVPRPADRTASAPGAFRDAVDRAMAQRAAGEPAPRETVPHPFYEGEFVDPRTGAIVHAEVTPLRQDPTDGGRLVPHPFYEGEYYDPRAAEVAWFGEDGITVADVIDLINPLQHIPIVSSIYREMTGDTIDPGIRMIAGAAIAGPIGFAVALVNSVIEDSSGRDVGGHVLAMIGGGEDAPVEVAALETASGPAPAPVLAMAAAQPAIMPASVRRALPGHPDTAAAGIPPTAPMLAAGPAMAAAGIPADTPTPAEALIQARAAVPASGAVAALGSSRAIRIATPDQTPEQVQQLAISAKLDAHLARLAAMSGERPQPAATAFAPPTPAPARPAPARVPPPVRPEPSPPAGPAAIPTPLVPQAMSDALEKYRAMMRPTPTRAGTGRDDSTL